MKKSSILYISMAYLFALGACTPAAPTEADKPYLNQPKQEETANSTSMPTESLILASPTSNPAQTTQETAAPAAGKTDEATQTREVRSTASLPDPSRYTWQLVAGELNKPIGIVNAGDSSERLFVVLQRGVILILQDGVELNPPFLDIRERIGASGSEQGLLGLAFHPRYKENGYFYVNYTDLNGDTVVARYEVSADANLADPGSETILLQVDQPYPNHNGGDLAFGPEGYLYIALGDGGAGGDPEGRAQSLNTLLGKLLRIDVDGGEPYSVPADNPYASGGGLPEIWAYGLRNPWRISFDQLTGDLYIGDVGQNAWEEVDFLTAGNPGGVNFGWDYREGMHPYEGNPPAGTVLIEPVAEYDHGNGCSVTGGRVYRGSSLPEWQGVYLYGDYCSGLVWGLLKKPDGSWENGLLFETGMNISSFGQDEAGEVYLADRNGSIYRLSAK